MINDIILVLINFNEPENTIRLIKNITNLKDVNRIARILILDNGDEPANLNELRNIGIQIENKKITNHGFGAALNLAIDDVHENEIKYLWSLNIDVQVYEDTLSELLAVIREDRIVGSVILDKYKEGYIQQYGTNGLNTWRGYKNVKPSKELDIQVDAVAGTSMMIGREVFSRIRFDEEYFMYVEENDYCYTAKQLGFNSYVCTKSLVVHESGGSFNNKSIRWYYKVRNLLKFKKKFGNKIDLFLISYLLIVTVKLHGLNISYLTKYLKAIFDYKMKKYGKYVEI